MGPVFEDEKVKKYPEINCEELKQEHVTFSKRWNNTLNLCDYVEIPKKSSEDVNFFS